MNAAGEHVLEWTIADAISANLVPEACAQFLAAFEQPIACLRQAAAARRWLRRDQCLSPNWLDMASNRVRRSSRAFTMSGMIAV